MANYELNFTTLSILPFHFSHVTRKQLENIRFQEFLSRSRLSKLL